MSVSAIDSIKPQPKGLWPAAGWFGEGCPPSYSKEKFEKQSSKDDI